METFAFSAEELQDRPPERLPEPTPEQLRTGVIENPTPEQRAWMRRTDEALDRGVRPEELSPVGTDLGHYAVLQARTQLGVTENPLGSNCGIPHDRYQVWIGGSGIACSAWCAYFAGWSFDTSQGGNKDHRAPWGTSGYVGTVLTWCQSKGHIVSVPSHGDVFGIGTTHMGLISGADTTNKTIYTCEGNYSDAVKAVLRNYGAGGLWFARI